MLLFAYIKVVSSPIPREMPSGKKGSIIKQKRTKNQNQNQPTNQIFLHRIEFKKGEGELKRGLTCN